VTAGSSTKLILIANGGDRRSDQSWPATSGRVSQAEAAELFGVSERADAAAAIANLKPGKPKGRTDDIKGVAVANAVTSDVYST